MDGENTEEGETSGEEVVAKITQIKLPQFWRSNPALWFDQAELKFRRAKIRTDRGKLEEILCQLDPEFVLAQADFFTLPVEEQTYEAFKKRLIAQNTDSESKRVQLLLQELNLDDRKNPALSYGR